jgi:hypothetical protein
MAAEIDPLLVQTSSMYDLAEANTAMKLRCPGLQATQPYSPRTMRPSVGPLSDTGLESRSILLGDEAGVSVDFVTVYAIFGPEFTGILPRVGSQRTWAL